MDKNKDNTFDVPAAEIQDKITLLMGLPPEEATARLDKNSAPRRISSRRYKSTDDTSKSAEKVTDDPPADTKPKPLFDEAGNETDDTVVDEVIAQEHNTNTESIAASSSDYTITPPKQNGIIRFAKAWWNHRILRTVTLLAVFGAVVFIVAFPQARYYVLNTVGVRASAQFRVVDVISGRPIKNVTVSIDDKTAKSDEEGLVKINDIKLGPTLINLQKRSFKEEQIPVTIGWGSNPFDGPLELNPTGTTFVFTAKDWLSGSALQNVEVSDGESVALSDENGLAKLTIEPTEKDIAVTFTYNTYRTETLTIPADTIANEEVLLVPSSQDVFISKRSGKYDIYSRYVDGTQETLLLPGTGTEQSDTHLLPNPKSSVVALVSSRDGLRNESGSMTSSVYLLDTTTKQVEKIDTSSSERVRLIGWDGDTVVFVKTATNQLADKGSTQTIVAYDAAKKEVHEVATASNFTDVRLIKDAVYYVLPVSDGSQSKGLTKSSLNNNEKKVLLAKNIWAVYRITNDTLQISAEGDEWYELTLENGSIKQLEGAPAVPKNITYTSNPITTDVAWLEERDGKTVLLVSSSNANDSKEITKQSGINYPIRWLNSTTILYTVATAGETADYIVSTTNGQVKKVGDVTLSVYADSQYYY
ncbi:MAG TPA: hypothetical protein PKV52_01375 [Candidatus Saccharibacteria bacterium]|nr:hypothetical protein [Candidatus Saccharibacteria bacterium]